MEFRRRSSHRKERFLSAGRSPVAACPADCPGCPDPEPDPVPDPELLDGWSLVGTSLLVFLVPLAFAVAGACLLRSTPLTQLLGSVLGLVMGILAVRLLLPRPVDISEGPE